MICWLLGVVLLIERIKRVREMYDTNYSTKTKKEWQRSLDVFLAEMFNFENWLRFVNKFQMPHLLHHLPPPPPPPQSVPLAESFEPIPPIPPRTRSRPASQQQTAFTTPNHPKSNFLCLDDLPSPDREWQLFENIGDGTYGEVFRVTRLLVLVLKNYFFS